MIQGTTPTSHSRQARWVVVACLLVTALAQVPAMAQHANFVLFGDPNPRAAEVPAEQKHVAPITAPYYNEDSFVTTDIRAWYLYHDFPKSSAIGGGNAKVYAAQLRLALTSRLQFVAYKDGYIDWDTGAVSDSGANDIAAGIKWNFIQDWDNQFHAAVGAGYELSTGSSSTLNDDSEWRFWASANKGYDRLHLGGNVNFRFADDLDDTKGFGSSDTIDWHLHADYFVSDFFSPVVEINGYHTTNEGSTAPLLFSGVDVVNLGGGKSEDVVTIGLGGEIRPKDNLALRAAYETPLTKNDDLFGYRWTLSLVWSF
jgi:hypothetical protein